MIALVSGTPKIITAVKVFLLSLRQKGRGIDVLLMNKYEALLTVS